MKMLPDVIKVLHLIDQYRIGGPGKTIINSARFIDRRRFNICVGTYIRDRRNKSDFQKVVELAGIPVVTLKDSRGIHIGSLRQLREYVIKNDISILHTHGHKSDIYGLFVKVMLPRIKLISTQHGWIPNSIRQKLYIYVDLLISRFFDGIIVVSEDMLQKLPGATRRRVPCTMVHNALVRADYAPSNDRRLLRQELGIRDGETAVGVIGRLSPEKGCLEILEAFSLLQRTNDIRTRLIFVGEGSLAEELRRKMAAWSLENSVILAGYRNPIQPVYEAIDILVCPSRTEGLSNVILEAFAYSLPVVTTAVGGNPELIKDGFNGMLVRPGSPEDLRNALVRLARSPSLRSELGQRGYETLLESFTFERRIKRVESFYDLVMSIHS